MSMETVALVIIIAGCVTTVAHVIYDRAWYRRHAKRQAKLEAIKSTWQMRLDATRSPEERAAERETILKELDEL